MKIKFVSADSSWEKQVELINNKKLKIYDDNLPILEFYKQTAEIENGQLLIHLS